MAFNYNDPGYYSGGGGGSQGVPASNDFSGMSYQDLANLIASRAGGGNGGGGSGFGGYQVAPEYQRGSGYMTQAYQDNGGGGMFANQPETRQATDTEKMFARLGEVGESLADPFGWFGSARQEYGNVDPRTLMAFVPSTIGGIASAPFSAASKGYEAMTGTDVESMDWDTGKISNEKLDSNQRAAVGLDAAIDLFGTAVGGSGRIIGAGINAGRAMAGNAGKQIGKGFVTRATGKPLGQFAFDVAEEGGEEFVQSYLGDVRHEQLDEGSFGRALEGAAWGAIGGGMMSGGGIAINRAVYGPEATEADERFQKDGANPQQTGILDPPGTSTEFERSRNDHDMKGRLSQSAAEAITERMAGERDIPASASVLNTTESNMYNLRQVGVGAESLYGIWMSATPDSKESMAHAFHTTTERLSQINNTNDAVKRLTGWKQLLDENIKAGRNVRVTVSRNPDTNDSGAAWMDITNIFGGHGASMARQAYKMFGADQDGDLSQIYFSDPGFGIQGYLTKNLVNAVNGMGTIDKDYIAFLGDRTSPDEFKKWLNAELKNLGASNIAFFNARGKKISASDVIKMMEQAYDSSFLDSNPNGYGSNDMVCRAFDNARRLLYEARINKFAKDNNVKRKDIESSEYRRMENEADVSVANQFHSMEMNSSKLEEEYTKAANDMISKNKQMEIAADELHDDIVNDLNVYFKKGDLSGNTDLASIVADLAMKIYLNTDLGNPFFRQGGQVYHESKRIRNDMSINFSNVEASQFTDVYARLIAFSFRLRDVGVEVETAIEGIFRTSIQDVFLTSWDQNYKIHDSTSFEEFLDKFAMIYDDHVAHFNKSWEQDTTRGIRKQLGSPKKETISGKSTTEKAEAFLDIFGSMNFEEILDISEKNVCYGRSVLNVVEECATAPGRYTHLFGNIEGFDSFWPHLLSAYGKSGRAQGASINKFIEHAAESHRVNNISHMIKKDDNGRYYVDDEDEGVMEIMMNGLHYIADPGTAYDLKIATLDAMLNSRWGRGLYSDDANEIRNSSLSINLTRAFGSVMDIIEATPDIANDQARYNLLISELSKIANYSPLHMAIFHSFIEHDDKGLVKDKDGNYKLAENPASVLAMLTNLDVDFKFKAEWFDQMQLDNVGAADILTESFKMGDSRIAQSAFSKRIIKAQREYDRADRVSFNKCQETVTSIQNKILSNEDPGWTSKTVGRAIRRLASQDYVHASSDLLATAIYSQRDIVKEQVSKGQSTDSSSAVFMTMNEINNGGNLSYVDQMGIELGTMSCENLRMNRVQLLSMMLDKDFNMRAWEADHDGAIELSQFEFFREFGITIDKDEGPSDDQIWELVQQVPQLISVIAPQSIDVVADGSRCTISSNVKESFDSAVDRIIGGGLSDEEALNREQNRNKIMQLAMEDPNLYPAIIGMSPGIENASLFETRKMVEDAMDKLTTWGMVRGSMGQGQIASDYFDLQTARNITGFVSDIRETYLSIAEVNEVVRESRQLSNYQVRGALDSAFGSMRRTMFENLKRMYAVDYVDKRSSEFAGLDPDVVDQIKRESFDKRYMVGMTRINDALMNMFDPRSTATAKIGNADDEDIREEINAQITRAQMTGDVDMEKAWTRIKSAMNSSWDSATISAALDNLPSASSVTEGDLGYMMFFDETGSPVMYKPQIVPSDDGTAYTFKFARVGGVALDTLYESFFDMTEDEAVDKCRTIMKKYDILESFTDKAEDAIRKAFKQPGMTDDKIFLRQFYNGKIISSQLKEAMQDTNYAMNTQFVMQTMDSQQFLLDFGEKVAKELGDKLPSTGEALPNIKFDFRDQKRGYMAMSSLMNMSSGSVGTEIGLDGMMTKLLAGIGLTGPNFMESQSGGSQSASNPILNRMAKMVEFFVNHTQEPMHLRFKKSTYPGAVTNIIHKTRTDPEIRKVIKYNKGQSLAGTLFDGVVEKRKLVAEYYKNKFSSPELKSLNWSDVEFRDLAELVIPYVEVFTADGKKTIVSVRDIRDISFDNTQTASALESAGIVSFRPVVVNLNEISAKITRGVAEKFYDPKTDRTKVTKRNIQDWAEEAYYDWSSYNESPMSIRSIINRVAARGDSFVSALPADFSLTAVQKWDDLRIGSMRNVFDSKSKQSSVNLMNKNLRKKVKSKADEIGKAKPDKNKHEKVGGRLLAESFIVARYVPGEGNEHGFSDMSSMSDVFSTYRDLSVDKNLVGSETEMDGRRILELTSSVDPREIRSLYEDAAARNHPLAIPVNALDSLSGVSQFVINSASRQSYFLYNNEFVVLDPNVNEKLSFNRHDAPTLSEGIIEPDSIYTVIGDPYYMNLTDGASYGHPDHKFAVHMEGRRTLIADEMFSGFSIIEKVTDCKEIANISDDQIMMDYYDKLHPHNKWFNLDDMKNKAKVFRDSMNGMSGDVSMVLKDVSNTDCIGFVKQSMDDGRVVYVPVFYEGSVPSMADSVKWDIEHGEVKIDYSSAGLDFGGNNTQKINIFGIEYKSMMHDADRDFVLKNWFVMDDMGFTNLFFKRGTPEVITDLKAMSGRVFDMGDHTTNGNLFYTSRKVGGNIFYERDGGTWKLKSGLNPSLTDGFLHDLTTGQADAWAKVANGDVYLFNTFGSDAANTGKLNVTIQRITSAILSRGGYPHTFFCPTQITRNEDGTDSEARHRPYNMKYQMFLNNFTRDQVLSVFNCMEKKLCPPNRDVVDDHTTLFDASGRMLCLNAEDKPVRMDTFVGPHFFTGEGTADQSYSTTASSSYQHMVKSLLRMGVYPKSIADTIEFLSMQTGDFHIANTSLEDRIKKLEKRGATVTELNPALSQRINTAIGTNPALVTIGSKYREGLSSFGRDNDNPIPITANDGETKLIDDKSAMRDALNAVDKFNNAADWHSIKDKATLSELANWVRYSMGYTNNDGAGMTSITVNQFVNELDHMASSIKERGLLTTGGLYRTALNSERCHMPVLPPSISNRLMTSNAVTAHHGSYKKFVDAQWEEYFDTTHKDIELVKDDAKRMALRKFADAMAYANGRDLVSGHITDNIYLGDLVSAIKNYRDKIGAGGLDILDNYEELNRLNEERLERLSNIEKSRKIITNPSKAARGGEVVLWKGGDKIDGSYILRNLASARKFMGLTYAMLAPANIVERTINQGVFSLALSLGQAGIGPYAYNDLSRSIPKGLTHSVSKDERVIKLWAAMRLADLENVSTELLRECRTAQDIDAAIEKVMENSGKLEVWRNKVLQISSGANVGISKQIQNFLDLFIQRAGTENAAWFIKDDRGIPFIQSKLESNPTQFLIEVFNGDTNGNYTSVQLATQCKNIAYKGDMAQKNIVSAIVAEIVNRSAKADFVTTAFISPYFQYATNRFGRLMQWVAPVSSLHYLLVDAASRTGEDATFLGNLKVPGLNGLKLNELNLADVQLHANLRQAMTVDIIHLGVFNTVILLLGMVGAIEPPEDKDKWGDFREWSYFGFRGEIPWWLEDCMGLVMPMAAFGKSCQLGQPRLDLLMNGMAHYLGNNPAVKVSDAVKILFDPMADLYQDYDNDLQGYAKAMSGPPSMTDMLNGKATSIGLSWGSQFITPGILREIYNGGLQWQKDYKHIYEEDETGRLTADAKENNDLQYTTYSDAIIRKYTRNNPVMGLLADLMFHPNTGYMAHEMPRTVIYDPDQMNSLEAFSLYNDPWQKKDPKTDEECKAIALQVVSILQGHDVEELHSIGFVLDYDTRAYVSKYIWDQIATMNEEYNDLEQSGAFDYYVAGDGDFTLGQKLVSEYKETHWNTVNMWKDLYREKLWASEIVDIARYNQVATTYRQDANGQWYAAGYRPSWWKPLTLAPGETPGDDYKFVGNREQDWQTESVVTGNFTGMRGLVPIEFGHYEIPDIQSWSTDGSDTGHSDIYGKNSTTNDSSDKGNGNKTTYPNGYSTRYGSRGGGGGGRRGGGGGGGRGGSPSIYSRVSTPNMPSAKTMNTSRNQEANLDYLRPSFQTKGSREAYRREDI